MNNPLAAGADFALGRDGRDGVGADVIADVDGDEESGDCFIVVAMNGLCPSNPRGKMFF